MAVLQSIEARINTRVENLVFERTQTHELGISAPVVSLEIAALEVVAHSLNFIRNLTTADGAK